MLLVLQAALSVVLLVGAGLLVRSLRNAESVPLGFDVDPLISIDLNMRGVTLDSVHAVALRTELLEAARGLPGVSKATFTRAMPFWNHSSTSLFVEGIDTVARPGRFEYNPVSPTISPQWAHVIRGRAFGEWRYRVLAARDGRERAMGKRQACAGSDREMCSPARRHDAVYLRRRRCREHQESEFER